MRPSLVALANVANRQGRRVADHIAGLERASVPSLGTAIVKVFSRTAAMTGWNETRLRDAGRPYRCIHAHPWNHATYYPGAEQMALKLLFDPSDGTILGAQAVGGAGVDKRIDVLATAMSAGLTAPDLADLELAYAPPFSSAKDPVNMLGYMSENVLSGECDVVEPDEVDALAAEGWTLSTSARRPSIRRRHHPGCGQCPARRPPLGRGRPRTRPVPGVLPGRATGSYRDRAATRAGPRGPQPRRWLHHLAGLRERPGRRPGP